ncbi:transcriptional regulator, ModE family [Campylobacter pinnipediorum subsp. caledonicus]|uniref:Transcriptional regulator, ModE family n=1 Tax=Campylobacter pinnipediorum subsp. caledonicus TaxID=1874362 RepID=A0A1S6U8F0_9BACT|nr:TOBE domain-containing protein [Campylobacter pinnipediorum]AQW86371.1 transcriptional regulator, ModE family [Campylobacter pinnipediorum subsp. caledonicus]AQW88024.1 transcriptional regulator, ModE family [Campylobacter pinnipediorum subsp. caledonicus]OPA71471.1 molybdenum-dependent transcriptional regulator [Campylobacter pinnipediorum subsp. caledonicus]
MKASIDLEIFLGDNVSVLQKHIKLLKAIDSTKSITKAAQAIGISYKNAWDSIDILNNKSDKPLVSRANGRKKNSGTELTEYGHKMIEIYEKLLGLQNDFLTKVCENLDISNSEIINFSRLSNNLSARNQLNCEIVDVKSGAVSSQIFAKLSNDDILHSSITLESEKNLNLIIGKKVVFIFKAPCVSLVKKDEVIKDDSINQLNGEVISVKIGSKNADVIIRLSDYQNLSAIVSKDVVMELKIGVGDKLKALVKSSDIIIGV